jgi:hypothetical protein
LRKTENTSAGCPFKKQENSNPSTHNPCILPYKQASSPIVAHSFLERLVAVSEQKAGKMRNENTFYENENSPHSYLNRKHLVWWLALKSTASVKNI